MSIGLNAQCMVCHLKRNLEAALKLGDEATASQFVKELMKLYLSMPEEASTPWLGPATAALFREFYHLPEDRYKAEKEASNRFVLERMESLRALAESQPDPVYAGLQLAVLGNYIDFAALQGQVSFEALDDMLRGAMELDLDPDAYAAFCRDLEKGKSLLYLTDNAGEIGFDRIFAEALHKRFPHVTITFCVRGAYAVNDATRADAAAVGIPFPVIDNGNDIAGTELTRLGKEAKEAFCSADVILSKGQGNAETLLGCGSNVYYAFLIKCPRFQNRFGKPKFTPMFVKEGEKT